MVKSNLKEEETLAEEIRKFSYLYDKNNQRCKEKDREKMHGMKWRISSTAKKVRNLNYEAVLCWKGGLLKTCSQKYYNGFIWKNVSGGDYLSTKIAIARKDRFN